MNSRERVIKTLRFQQVDRVPRNLWALPGVWRKRPDELNAIREQFPDDFLSPSVRYGCGSRCRGEQARVGEYVDAWGSGWVVAEEGVVGEVKSPPLGDWSALKAYTVPRELLDNADFSDVDRCCRESDRFVLAGTETRPFERMQFLRGTENLLMDLACQPRELFELRDMLHEFSVREMRMWAQTQVDGVSFMDDWGSQQGLLISPDTWRQVYKPLYREYCEILHAAGKYVFFHSDGNIESIYPDLIEIGVNAVNSQLFCMDIERLGRQYAGKVVFWGEIDRQNLLPFGTPAQIADAVKRAAGALMPAGLRTGVIAQCEWGIRDPADNIRAVFSTWDSI